ncbi:MAG: DegQ family serine endoprotease [Opitutaceae bacterium]
MNILSIPRLRRSATYGAAGIFAAAGLFAALHATQIPPRHPELNIKIDTSNVRSAVAAFSYAPVVKRVAPSVVKITVELEARNLSLGAGAIPFGDPFFRQFFGNRPPQIQQAPESGLGSGVIVSSNGYIVTNNHVVDGAKDVTVTLADGRQFKARVIGRDPETDVAVIKIDAHHLPAITFAPSKDVEVGDRVLAIGNPFGIGETVTTGIVSATGRHAAGLKLDYEDFIQTDAAINPGNSGGALVDADGRLIGINTAILSKTGGFQGVGFAVPSDLVKSVADSLVATGRVDRGYLGVSVQDLTTTLADSFGISGKTGALVSDVRADSPAARAGLKSGDVIVGMNGAPVEGASQLSLAVAEAGPGAHLTLQVEREGKSRTIDVTTIEKPNTNLGQGESSSSGDQSVLKGVGVSDIDGPTRAELNLPDRLHGALITEVAPDSAAARAGLRPGDVILEINRHPVDSAKTAVDLSEHASGRRTLVKLWSHGNTVYVVVDETGSSDGSSGDGP